MAEYKAKLREGGGQCAMGLIDSLRDPSLARSVRQTPESGRVHTNPLIWLSVCVQNG